MNKPSLSLTVSIVGGFVLVAIILCYTLISVSDNYLVLEQTRLRRDSTASHAYLHARDSLMSEIRIVKDSIEILDSAILQCEIQQANFIRDILSLESDLEVQATKAYELKQEIEAYSLDHIVASAVMGEILPDTDTTVLYTLTHTEIPFADSISQAAYSVLQEHTFVSWIAGAAYTYYDPKEATRVALKQIYYRNTIEPIQNSVQELNRSIRRNKSRFRSQQTLSVELGTRHGELQSKLDILMLQYENLSPSHFLHLISPL